MNTAYGAWGSYGGPFDQLKKGTKIQTQNVGYSTGNGISVFKPGPQAQVALTAAANGGVAPVQGGVQAPGPSLADILAGIGSIFAPQQVAEQQAAEVATAAADGRSQKPWLLIGLGIGGLVILGTGAYFLLRSKRRR